MKKLLTFCILILLVPGFFGFTAYAYDYEPIKYEIEVEVTLGGTAFLTIRYKPYPMTEI